MISIMFARLWRRIFKKCKHGRRGRQTHVQRLPKDRRSEQQILRTNVNPQLSNPRLNCPLLVNTLHQVRL
jgi:hypothetical protein